MFIIFGCAGSSLLDSFSLVADSGGYSVVMVHRLLIMVASLVAEHRHLGIRASVVVACGLSSHLSWALEHRLSSCGAGA